MNTTTLIDVRPLRAALTGDVVTVEDESWDEARQAWNPTVDQRPAAVVLPETVEDVRAAVRFAYVPWQAEHTYLNFAETRRGSGSLFTAESLERLRRIKAEVDPDDVIRSNHPL